MNAIAPGKVILSGEHSVVYGAPAIAVAVSAHIHTSFEVAQTPSEELGVVIGADTPVTLPCDYLDTLKQTLDQRFHELEAGNIGVSELLDNPEQLLFYAMAQCGSLPAGTLTTSSSLPTGSGMGSSAAAIGATLALAERLVAKPLSLEQRFALVRHCERLQHGRGSAIDAAAVTYGGLIQVQNSAVTRLSCHLGAGWYRVNSGRPAVSTGQCVEAVRARFADSDIWQEFAQVTQALPDALDQVAQHDDTAVLSLIRQNHRLLCKIGVVPEPVQRFVESVELLGGAAKISGAGAHQGKCGGLVLVYLPAGDIQALCQQFGYELAVLEEDRAGAHFIED